MQKSLTKFLILAFILTAALSVNYLFATWSGPTQAPPGGNTSMPIHVGATNQVKNGGLSLNGLSVFGGGYFQGNVGVGVVVPTQKLDVSGYVKGQSGVCIGNDCRTSWPSSGSAPHGDGTNCPAGQTPSGVDANGNAQGCFVPSGGGFGDWETRNANTVYQATTDGFVVGWTYNFGNYRYVEVKSDSFSSPTTVRHKSGSGSTQGTGVYVPFNVPVKKGNYYKAETYGSPDITVFWLPVN